MDGYSLTKNGTIVFFKMKLEFGFVKIITGIRLKKAVWIGFILWIGLCLFAFTFSQDQDIEKKYRSTLDISRFSPSYETWAIQYDAWWPEGPIQKTIDGGFIVPLGLYLVKISSAGYIQWQYKYLRHLTRSIASTPDGGCVSAGEAWGYKAADLSLMKISTGGNVEWKKSYGYSQNPTFMNEVPESIQNTRDGGYIVAGYSRAWGPWDTSSQILILKLTSSGNLEWIQEYTYRLFEGRNEAYSVYQTNDDGYIVAGFVGAIRHEERLDVCLIKLSSIGQIEWIKLYGGLKREGAFSVQQTMDGGYVVGGHETSLPGQMGALILKLSPFGQIEWQKSFKRDIPLVARSVFQTSDGGYVVAGSGFDWNEKTDIWFLKLSSSGEIEWQKTYDREKQGAAYSIQSSDIGGYIAYGGIRGLQWFTDHFIDVERPLILKLDSKGGLNSSCGLIQDMHLKTEDTSIIPQEIFFGDGSPSQKEFFVEDETTKQEAQAREFTLLCGHADLNKFFPPQNFLGVKVFNRSLSQAEYINILSWEVNPKNEKSQRHRVYLFKGGTYIFLAELDAGKLSYKHRNVNQNEKYAYILVAVNDQNRESYPVYTEVE